MFRHRPVVGLVLIATAMGTGSLVLGDPPQGTGTTAGFSRIDAQSRPEQRGRGPEAAGTLAGSPAGVIEVPGCRVKLAEEAILASDRSGILDFVVAREGTAVRAGEEVAHLRDNVIRATLAIAETEASNDVEVRFAEKASELAHHKYMKDLQINQSLPGAVTEHDLREARLSAERALLQFEQAKQKLEVQKLKRDETREMLKNYSVKAPFNGVVRTIFKRQGEAVGEGEPIAELINTETVRVEGALPLEDAPLVRAGSAVEIVPEYGTSSAEFGFYGEIVFVDVKVEPVSEKIRVVAEVRNRNNDLKDGLKATMRIVPRLPQAAGRPPASADPRSAAQRAVPRQ